MSIEKERDREDPRGSTLCPLTLIRRTVQTTIVEDDEMPVIPVFPIARNTLHLKYAPAHIRSLSTIDATLYMRSLTIHDHAFLTSPTPNATISQNIFQVRLTLYTTGVHGLARARSSITL